MIMSKMYRVYVKKEAEYLIRANSKEHACEIADEWLCERNFDDYSIVEDNDDWEFDED